ncbi:MAG: Sau3AI family type II restriction endonuclease [Eubacteriales bacterium]|nr:Sau3AI family type II restriction endonuclease [Eubacteriales bacterium]
MDVNYNYKDAQSIESFAKELIGKTFLDVINEAELNNELRIELIDKYGNRRRTGGLGNLLEEVYFGYKANSNKAPDFDEAGVELKVTPYEKGKKGVTRAGERLVISMIGYKKPIELDFQSSGVWNKIRSILLIIYWRNEAIKKEKLKYPIDYVKLFSPPEVDLKIIKDDYTKITRKIMDGKAHELSESDTMYLGACTKGDTAMKSLNSQFYNPSMKAKSRAFCLKNSYMTYVLNNYIIRDVAAVESILDKEKLPIEKTFEDYIVETIDAFTGKTDEALCRIFGREYNNDKSLWSDLAFKILGVKSNRAEEFLKANIVVKAIRLEANGKMAQNMSFPAFKYKELVEEVWEESTLHDYFDETRFLFVVYKFDGNNYVLKGCQFWNMPYDDLDVEVRTGWESITNTIKRGVVLTPVINTKGKAIVKNSFPGKSENRIIHVRPHATKSFYRFEDGSTIGNGTESHANELPDGRWMTNYCFWINNEYIISQLKEELK